MERKNEIKSIFNYEEVQVITAFRELWEQHVFWTQSYIVSAIGNLPDLDAVTNRLLRNPVDFEKLLRIFYGNEKANTFKVLFTDHLLLAAKVLDAVKAGDMKTASVERKKWYENADNIALFLSEINPYWSREMWQEMFYSHLKMVEEMANKELNKEYSARIDVFDKFEKEAMEMSDLMSKGIIKQFRI